MKESRVFFDEDWPRHVILEKAVKCAKEGKTVNAAKASRKLTNFGRDFISYLQKHHDLDIWLGMEIGISHWDKLNKWWIYRRYFTYLINDPSYTQNITRKFFCPFLDVFIEYNELL